MVIFSLTLLVILSSILLTSFITAIFMMTKENKETKNI